MKDLRRDTKGLIQGQSFWVGALAKLKEAFGEADTSGMEFCGCFPLRKNRFGCFRGVTFFVEACGCS
eukprot:933101-Pelagomonas_calceolata.AAC.5